MINKYSILNGSKYFSFDRLQNYAVFDLIIRNNVPTGFSTEIETNGNNKIISGTSTELLQEKIINPYKSDTTFSPQYNYPYKLVTFKGICLKQKNVSFIHKKVVNPYISYKSDTWSKDLKTDFTLGDC